MAPRDPTKRNRRAWNGRSDAYQAMHDPQLSGNPLAWGVWGIPEAQLAVLGDVEGRDVLEFGCGAAQWCIALAQRGARPVGMDLSDRQLAHARRLMTEAGAPFPLVHATAERAPFADASFDVVFCDHGAMTFARPERTVAEASRLVRPGGIVAFNMCSPLHDICWDPVSDKIASRLIENYFTLDEIEDDEAVCYQLPHGAWIRLFRRHGLVVEDLIELRPPDGAQTTYEDFVSLDWARQWPAENIWKLSKKGTDE